MDRPDGLYSTMDVDSVDAEKYPGLDNVQYEIAEIHGGDCVFIPYIWRVCSCQNSYDTCSYNPSF